MPAPVRASPKTPPRPGPARAPGALLLALLLTLLLGAPTPAPAQPDRPAPTPPTPPNTTTTTIAAEADDPPAAQDADPPTAAEPSQPATDDPPPPPPTEETEPPDVRETVEGAAGRVGQRVERWARFLPLLPIAAAMLAGTILLAWLIGRWHWPFDRLTKNPFLSDIARKLAQGGVMLAGLLLTLELLNATAMVGGVLGAAGVAGIAIGFAFRDLIENYVASILLSLRQPFRPRDHVIIDGHEGLVTTMNSRTTVLTTFDGNVVRIPNATVFKSPLINYSTDPRRRFSFEVGVGYDVDLALAISVGAQTLQSTEGVMDQPAPFAIVTRLGESSITIQLFAWVHQQTHDFGKVRSLAMQRVKSEYDRLDIDMPEPIYNIKLATDRPAGTTPTPPAPETKPKAPTPTPPTPPTPPTTPSPIESPPEQDVTRDDTAQEFADINERASDTENLLRPEATQE
ncbi:MAG: mechanosensitive ion channel family protein [Phycisphaerales bacterium]